MTGLSRPGDGQADECSPAAARARVGAVRDSIDIPPSLERAVFGVVEYLDAPSLGGLIKASNALRLECEAQESWRRLERRESRGLGGGGGTDRVLERRTAELASLAKIRSLHRRRLMADALLGGTPPSEIVEVQHIRSGAELTYFVRVTTDDSPLLWEGQLPTKSLCNDMFVSLDLSSMWSRLKQMDLPGLHKFLSTPTDADMTTYSALVEAAFVTNGICITVVAIRADGRMCPLGATYFSACNGTYGETEQSYVFESRHLLAGCPWNTQLFLETHHRTTGGTIDSCHLCFAEHSGGVVSDDSWVGIAGEDEGLSIAAILNQLQFV